MAQKKKQNKQGKQSQRIETNSCQDSPCLVEGRRERRKDVHGRSSSKVQGTSTLESTPPGSETSTLSLHNPLLPFRTIPPCNWSPKKCIHTRAQALEPISGFEIRETRVRWGASRRRVPTEAVVFPSGSTESRGGGGRLTVPTPPPFPYPRPQSTPTGANSKPRGAQSSTGRRSPLSKGANTFQRGIVVEDIFCGCLESCCCSFSFFLE